MNLKRKIKVSIFTLLMASTSVAMAGKGIDFLYGVGGGVFYSEDKTNITELDAAAAAEFIIGFEEDGFAFEMAVANTLEAGTAVSTRDYKASIQNTTLAYRTIEKNKKYYKIKFGSMKVDLDFSDATSTLTADGNVFGVGMGMRMARDERMELEYMFYSSSDIDNTHMLVLRYLFGGTPPDTGFK